MNRKLVEITPTNYSKLSAIRRECKRNGGITPSMPALVNAAISRALPGLVKQFLGK